MSKRVKSDISTEDKKAKRVKIHHGKSNISSKIPKQIDCFRLEEQEAPCDFHGLFSETCAKLRHHLLLLSNIKRCKENRSLKMQQRLHICILIMRLKKLNRLDKHQWKKSKDIVNEHKQNVDAMNLQYQNLVYEATHLQKEVTKCTEFKSVDEDIPLVTIEEFYKEAPTSISKPEITKKDPHELSMARLIWEMEQRKTLGIKLKEADVRLINLEKHIRVLQENISSIEPVLAAIILAAEPFLTKMGLSFQASQLRFEVAKYLPEPLYILYAQACAYKEHCKRKTQGKIDTISIEGNEEDAKAMIKEYDIMSDDSGESDQEDGAETSVHRRSISEKKKLPIKDILLKHPMSIVISITNDLKIDLEFKYMPLLKIVTVNVISLSPEPMSTEFVGNLLEKDCFLNCLFNGDTGKDTPNLANVHNLISKYGGKSIFSNSTTGLPYIWTQKIAGLSFLSPSTANDRKMFSDIPMGMKKAIRAISSRLSARYQLYNQIKSLAEEKITVSPEFTALYPVNIPSELKKWCPTSWTEILKYVSIDELQNLSIVDDTFLFYNAEIQRGSAVLLAHVCIPPNYPNQSPVILLQLNWNGSHSTVSSLALRELEEEVNVHFLESLASEFKQNMLLCQLYHLLVCFDVFLEIESSGGSLVGPLEFTREKVVVRHARGLGRSRPYKCVSSQGIFTYR